MALFSSLQYRSFALLWSGQTLSLVGDHLYQIALAWWVLEKTGSATAMGMVLIFSFTPMLLFLLIGGVAADRFSRVPLMFLSDLARGCVVCLVALLAWAQRLDIWHIYLASLIFGLVDAFFQPAYTAAVPELTPADSLTSAHSLTSLSQQLGRIVGPLLGAAMVTVGGTAAAFALNGLSFFVSAACLVPLLSINRPAPSSNSQSSSVFHDLREGLGTVLAVPWLWITIGLLALAN